MRQVLFLMLCLATTGMAFTDFSGWKDSLRIYINTTALDSGADLGSDVADFPLLVRLDTANFDFDKAPHSPLDFRFSDPDGAELPSQISRWEKSGSHSVDVWVRVPKIDGQSATDFVTLHWGNPSITDGLEHRVGNQSTFDSAGGFAGVWHLDETDAPMGGKAVFRDAANTNNHGNNVGRVSHEAGRVGQSQVFDGESDVIEIPNSESVSLDGPLTISAWIRPESFKGMDPGDDISQVNTIVRKGGTNPNNFQLALNSGHLMLTINGNDDIGVHSTRELELGKWVHVAGVWNGAFIELYFDGHLDINQAFKPSAKLGPDTRPVYIGGRDGNKDVISSLDYFHGGLDEVQISKVARSRDWLRLAYENQKPNSRTLVFSVQDVPEDTGITLVPGQVYRHENGINLSLSSQALGQVAVQFSASEANTMRERGMSQFSETITVQSKSTDSTFTSVIVSVGDKISDSKNLFQIKPGKEGVDYLYNLKPTDGKWVLPEPGDYFFGQDTVVPRINVLGMGFTKPDTTWLDVQVEDNVQNLVLTASIMDKEKEPQKMTYDTKPGKTIRIGLSGRGDLTPLGISLLLKDGNLHATFPANEVGTYWLPKQLSEIKAPIGLNPDMHWTLVGIPAVLHQPVSMRDVSATSEVFGAIWQNSLDKPALAAYRLLRNRDTLPTGTGIWLASRTKMDKLTLTQGQSIAPNSFGQFSIPLTKGWNQVTCPSLSPLPWPVTHRDTVAEDLSSVKALQAFNGVTGGYSYVDSLYPWQGYFVYSQRDTTVVLAAPKISPLAKVGDQNRVQVPVQILVEPSSPMWPGGSIGQHGSSVSSGRHGNSVLRLGAALYGQDGLAIEDSRRAPGPGLGEMAEVSLVRSGQELRSDLMKFQPGKSFSWKVAWHKSKSHAKASQDGSVFSSEHAALTEVGRLKVAGLRLPPEMKLWVGSNLRKVAEELHEGSEIEVLGDGNDTLVFWALSGIDGKTGPFAGYAMKPRIRSVLWESQSGYLKLKLPHSSGLKINFWDMNGNKLESFQKMGLAAGYYDFSFPKCKGHSGIRVITVDFIGGKTPGRISLKSIQP